MIYIPWGRHEMNVNPPIRTYAAKLKKVKMDNALSRPSCPSFSINLSQWYVTFPQHVPKPEVPLGSVLPQLFSHFFFYSIPFYPINCTFRIKFLYSIGDFQLNFFPQRLMSGPQWVRLQVRDLHYANREMVQETNYLGWCWFKK